jgi:pyrrolidone-carboxylate peptidase
MAQARSTSDRAPRSAGSVRVASAAGKNAIAVPPPRYGIDFIDDETAALGTQGSTLAHRGPVASGDAAGWAGPRIGQPLIQRKCASCEEEELLRRKAIAGQPAEGWDVAGPGFAVGRVTASVPAVQAKLAVSSPSDPYEREADDVADKVLRMAEPAPGPIRPASGEIVQRACADCEERPAREETAEEMPAAPLLQRKTPLHASGGGGYVAPAAIGALRGGGGPLPPAVRAFFEPRLGTDLGDVRVHADARAAGLASAMRAEAFTVGSDVVFGAGRYAPATSAGQRLLAHELVHVLQQRAGAPAGLIMRRWDAATSECSDQPTDKWIERVVVEQETPQSVTLFWSDQSVEADTCSTGKGHCCVDPATPEVVGCSVQESQRDGSNCTPITGGAGYPVAHRDLDHRGISFWTEFVPGRAIALHTYTPVDGTPLSHGCVRLHQAMAKKIFCGSRQRRTMVEVRGFARPRCDHPTLQHEWEDDFALAGRDVPDGDPAMRRSILEERRALNDAFGRRLGVQEIRGFTAADIPRCTATGARPTHEERALTTPVSPTATAAAGILAASGFTRFGRTFMILLTSAGSVARARQIVQQQGRALWSAATARAQGRAADSDDRPLYWARLEMTRALRQWQPQFPISAVQRQELEDLLEQTSRGMTTAAFSQRGTARRILVSGFDPFALATEAARGNPSGAAVLALDGKTLTDGGNSAMIQGVILPVRFADFDAGVVERFFRPYLTGPAPVSMIMTISQGSGAEFEVEEFAGRRRSATQADNQGTAGGGTPGAPATPLGIGQGPEFLRTTLPAAAIRQTLGRSSPLPEETTISEIPAGSTAAVSRTSGPTSGSTAVTGAGGGYLSNEIFYRTSLLRLDTGATVPVGHLHTPFLPAPQSGIRTPAFDTARDRIIRTVERILTGLIPSL